MPTRRRTYHHGNLRATLVMHGLELLDRGGVESVTLREAARMAGVSHAAPLNHFPDRRRFLTALAAESCRQLAALKIRRRDEAGDEAGLRLRATGLAYIEYAHRHPHRFRLMWRGDLIAADDPDLRQASAATWQVLIDCMRAFLAARGSAGRELEPRLMLALAVVHGLSVLGIDGGLHLLSAHGKGPAVTPDRILDLLADAFAPPPA